nr:AMP-binding protein [Planosporangium mesophilum]
MLAAAARVHGPRTWLRTDDLELSFEAAAGRVAAIAHRLRGAGVGRGDLVVLTARNEPEYLLVHLAVTALGAVAVPTNPRGSQAELCGLLTQVAGGLRAVVTDRGLCDVVADALREAHVSVPLLDAGQLAAAPPAADLAVLDASCVEETDVAVMIPTSGTTGRSKLVMQTHRAHVMAGEGFPYWMELTADDRLMTSLPLFHTNALAYSTMGSLSCGAGLVLLPRFSASGFLDTARRHGATSFNAIGAMLEFLMEQPPRPDDAETPLRSCYVAPSPPRERHLEIERRFGIRLSCGYGMSESLYGMSWRPGTRPFGTLGWPRQHPTLGEVNEARVVDEAGRDAADGATGELLLRNPTLTRGYYGMPDETAAALAGGWLHTGDLVTRNADGTFTFVARKKEVIRRRGENLSPAEVEQALRAHPQVVECAVVGVPAGMAEEEVKAYVLLAGDVPVPPSQLAEWVAGRLAAFKVPRFWQFVDTIPTTPTGRIAKHRLPGADEGVEYDLAAPRTSTVRS